jgi:NADH-quinone oxidoreductase subunit H
MWVRWSLPRFRFDQLMQLAWRALIPIALVTLLMTAIVLYFAGAQSDMYKAQHRIDGGLAAIFFLANVILLALVMIASRMIPAAPDTNHRMRVLGSRYQRAAAATAPLTTTN